MGDLVLDGLVAQALARTTDVLTAVAAMDKARAAAWLARSAQLPMLYAAGSAIRGKAVWFPTAIARIQTLRDLTLPAVPATMSSALLRRRPDTAAAEYRLAAIDSTVAARRRVPATAPEELTPVSQRGNSQYVDAYKMRMAHVGATRLR